MYCINHLVCQVLTYLLSSIQTLKSRVPTFAGSRPFRRSRPKECTAHQPSGYTALTDFFYRRNGYFKNTMSLKIARHRGHGPYGRAFPQAIERLYFLYRNRTASSPASSPSSPVARIQAITYPAGRDPLYQPDPDY